MTARRRAGFTLVEVLVALFVVALGMGALMATLTSAADTTAMLRDRSLAQWVALNRVSETRLKATAPSKGKSDGDIEFAGMKWRWQQEVSDPGIAGILRIDVSVSPAGGKNPDSLATATGFYGTAVAAPNGLTPDWTAVAPPVAGGAGTTTTPGTGTGVATPSPSGGAVVGPSPVPTTPTPGSEAAR